MYAPGQRFQLRQVRESKLIADEGRKACEVAFQAGQVGFIRQALEAEWTSARAGVICLRPAEWI